MSMWQERFAAAAVVAVAVVSTAGCAAERTPGPLDDLGASSAPDGVPPLDRVVADRINADLMAGSPSSIPLPEGVVAPPETLSALAASAPWEFDLAGVRYLGADSAAVVIRTSGPDTASWLMVLVLRDGSWQLTTSHPVPR